MTQVVDPNVGRSLDNRYTITRRLAEGGMASVYLADDNRLERVVAIKIIHSQLANGPHKDQFLHRFHAEAKAAAALSNPHIVQVYDTGELDDLQYIVMEYVHGVNLRQALEREPVFSVRDCLRVLSQTLDGLASAHQAGLVHRDIKPENILINARGHVQIADFGLAKVVTDATVGTTGLLLGTASYLAPEIIEDNRATPASDLYSVGIMGYEMLSGQLPFASDNPITTVFKNVNNDVPPLSVLSSGFPPVLVDFIGRLSSRDPARRPADATQAYEELSQLVTGLDRDQLSFRYSPAGLSKTSLLAPPQPVRADGQLPLTADRTGRQTVPPPDSAAQPGSEPAAASLISAAGLTTSTAPQSSALPAAPATGPAVPSADEQTTALLRGKGGHGGPTGHRRAILFSLSGLVVLVAALLVAWWWFLGPGSYWVVPQAADRPCSSQSAACNLTGASFKAYERTLDAQGITYSDQTAFSDSVAAGKIISSQPTVNGHVPKHGGQLRLIVSKGVKQVTVPTGLLDCSATPDAVKSLRDLGFDRLDITEEYSLDTPKGCAIKADATPGASLAHNAPVHLTVSQGPKPVQVPQLAGTSQDDATRQLTDLKLKVSVSEDFSDSIAKGAVIDTKPDGGQNAHWGDSITLVVSKGPQTVAMPNLVNLTKDQATKKLTDLGLQAQIQTQSSSCVILGLFGCQPSGTVTGQGVAAGTQVRLRDSSGKPTVITLLVVQ